MAFNFSPTSYTARPLDFSALADLPDIFRKGQAVGREDELRNWIKANPNAPIDEVARQLMGADPVRGAQLLQSINNQDALNAYHAQQVATQQAGQVPDDIKLLKAWQEMQPPGAEPMRAGPAEPSGVPGMNFQTAPAFITDKFAPVAEKKRLEAEGTAQGQRDSAKAGLAQAGPTVQKMIDQLVVNTKEADNDTFENALGPLQGAGEAEDWKGAVGQFFPQTAGSIANYFDKGMKEGFVDWKTGNVKSPGELPGGYTTTVRDKINTTQASLVNVLQRILRVPGIGQQSDKELQQLMNQVGALNKSRTKADFYDRLSNVVSNFNSLGIPVEMPTLEELAGTQPTSAAVKAYTNRPPQEAGAPYDAAQPEPPAAAQSSSVTNIGGEPAVVGPGAVPPPPPKAALGRLSTALKAHPEMEEEIKAAFERKFGRGQKGYADHYIYGEGR